jgi:ribonuclease P protein component
MALRYAYNPRQTTYRLAVIVSRKIHKSAVQRNRVRRRLYAIVQQVEDRITEPCDLVLTVYSDQVVSLPQPELEELVRRLLLKGSIIPPSVAANSTPGHGIVGKTSEES